MDRMELGLCVDLVKLSVIGRAALRARGTILFAILGIIVKTRVDREPVGR